MSRRADNDNVALAEMERKLAIADEEIKRLRSEIADAKKEQVSRSKEQRVLTNAGRRDIAIKMRERGETYAAIGRELGVTVTRARQIIISEKRLALASPTRRLSVRTENCIFNALGFVSPLSSEQVIEAAQRIKELWQQPQFGKRSARELVEFAASLEAR